MPRATLSAVRDIFLGQTNKRTFNRNQYVCSKEKFGGSILMHTIFSTLNIKRPSSFSRSVSRNTSFSSLSIQF
jgi:hypothetical protein